MSDTQYKLCGRCKKLIPLKKYKALCNACEKLERAERKKYLANDDRYKEAQKVYGSSRYNKSRIECKKRARGMCEVCYIKGLRVNGCHCHHITTVLNGNKETHYNIDNLVYVCKECHKIIEGMEEDELLTYLLTIGE